MKPRPKKKEHCWEVENGMLYELSPLSAGTISQSIVYSITSLFQYKHEMEFPG